MPRLMILECMQEVSSFNPVPSQYEDFHIIDAVGMLAQRGLNTALGGACSVFDAQADIELVPVISATAGSAGLLSSDGWTRLHTRILTAVQSQLNSIDGIYISLHGAMGAHSELDPEGYLLASIRDLAGPDVPIVISLDLHGILTPRMLDQIDALAVYHTYPHVDFAATGARAAKLMLRLLREDLHPVIARCVVPALVRGDELITRSGCYGDLIRECQRLEHENRALAAAIMIGNPFTDVPELCTQVLVITDGETEAGSRESQRIAEELWPQRHRMQGKLMALDRAIAQARTMCGSVVFTDAADATSSGATGDSNLIIRRLADAGYEGRVLAQIVDADAAAAAHASGVGASVQVTLGGSIDPQRFNPWPVTALVKSLSDGEARLETMQTPLFAGLTAVLVIGNLTVVVLSRTISLFDRAMYYANGLDPRDFDLIVVKSPHTEHHMYDAWITHNFNIDVPGATSADLCSLGHSVCARPMYPLEPHITFSPVVTHHSRNRGMT